MFLEEEKRLEEERKQRQDKMLEEARIDMIRTNSNSEAVRNENLEKYRILEREISKIASKYAQEYLELNPECELEQITWLYKVLILPEKSIKSYFDCLDEASVKKEFRKFTILLHPDKNSHPKSKIAFQKIYGIFEQALKSKKEFEQRASQA